ncbi:MAG: AsmA-like C-terminal region-containing protein [Pseudomonadota bacterium]
MRKLLIAAGVALLLALVLALAAIAAVPLFFEDRIASVAVDEANQQLEAHVTIQDVDLGLLRSFPNLSLGLHEVTVTGTGVFEGQPLAAVDEARLVLDLMSVIKGGPYIARKVSLVRPSVSIVIDEEGRSNADILPASAPSSGDGGGALGLDLRAIEIRDGRVEYNDRKGRLFVSAVGLDHDGSGRLGEAGLEFDTHTTIAALTVRDGPITWLKGARLGLDVPVTIEQPSGRITLGQSKIALNDLRVGLAGTVEPRGKDYALGLGFQALDTSFKSLLSLVPAVYTDDFSDVKVAGTLALQGKVSGILPAEGDDLPSFDIAMQVSGGSFTMPDLPTGVEDVQLDLALNHPGGDPDKITVDLSRFSMSVARSPVTGSLKLRHPVSDPDIAARVKGRVDLATLHAALPYEGVEYSGTLDLDLDVAGKLSQLQGGRRGPARAEGRFSLENASWKDPELPAPIKVQRLQGSLDLGSAVLDALQLTAGSSDLAASGRLTNPIGWALADEPLSGSIALRSNLLDTRPWLADGDEGDDGEEGTSLVAVPASLDLTVDTEVKRLLYEDLELTDLEGRLRLEGGTARLEGLEFTTLGGRVSLDGAYTAPTDRYADVKIQVEAVDFEVGKTAAAFETLRRIAPIAERASGRFSTAVLVQTRLDANADPDLPTLFSKGQLTGRQLRLQPAFLARLGEKLGNDDFATMDLSKGALGFTVQNGKVRIQPTNFAIAGTAATFSGTTGVLDQALDLTLDLEVPVGRVKAADVLSQLGAAQGGKLPLQVLVGGTFDKPTLRIAAPSAVEAVAGVVAGIVGGRAGEVVDAAVEQARAAGDKLVAEAEKQAQALRDQAKKAGDRLKDEARDKGDALIARAKGNPIAEAAAKETAKKLNKEARQAAKKLEDEADTKGDALVAAAAKKRDDLVAKAEAKAQGR